MNPEHRSSCVCDECRPRVQEDERARVEAWRLKTLLEAGFSVAIAERVAASDADLHKACELVDQGCEPAVAALIVL